MSVICLLLAALLCCRWHGISSLNNLVVLAATVAYGWILAGRLSL
jgi:hypothetical protein